MYVLDNNRLYQEMKKSEYKDLILTNIFFHAIFKNATIMNEEFIIKTISLLCRRIDDLENDLYRKKCNYEDMESRTPFIL